MPNLLFKEKLIGWETLPACAATHGQQHYLGPYEKGGIAFWKHPDAANSVYLSIPLNDEGKP